MRTSTVIKSFVALLLLSTLACNLPNKNHKWVIPDKLTAEDSLHLASIQDWRYFDSAKVFTHNKTYYGEILCKKPVNNNITANSTSYCYLRLKYINGENYCFLELNHDVFDYNAGVCEIRFDGGALEKYDMYASVKEDLSIVGINGADSIISKMKKSVKMTVEVNMAKGGQKTFEFEVVGLKWEHTGKYAQKDIGIETMPEENKHWRYFDTTDAMSPGGIHGAKVNSSNGVNCGPVYLGNTYSYFWIDNYGHRMNYAMKLAKLGFDRSVNVCRIRLDNNEPIVCRLLFPDKDVRWTTIDEGGSFIEELKNAKKMLIEVDIDKVGKRIFEFNVSGLKWPYKNKN